MDAEVGRKILLCVSFFTAPAPSKVCVQLLRPCEFTVQPKCRARHPNPTYIVCYFYLLYCFVPGIYYHIQYVHQIR